MIYPIPDLPKASPPESDMSVWQLVVAWQTVNAQRLIIEEELSRGVLVSEGFMNRRGLHEALNLLSDIEEELNAIARSN